MSHDDGEKKGLQYSCHESTRINPMPQGNYKPIICLDFDGVIHSYITPWRSAEIIPDGPTEGFFEWARAMLHSFKLVVHSSRFAHDDGSPNQEAIGACIIWLAEEFRIWCEVTNNVGADFINQIKWSATKPPAFISIDDRCICFDGDWSKLTAHEIMAFRPWNQSMKRSK